MSSAPPPPLLSAVLVGARSCVRLAGSERRCGLAPITLRGAVKLSALQDVVCAIKHQSLAGDERGLVHCDPLHLTAPAVLGCTSI